MTTATFILSESAPASVGSDDPTAKIAQAAADIGGPGGRLTLEVSIRIGKAVIDELHGGELSRWRTRGPKTHSLRKLSQSASLGLSTSSLYRAVAIYELHERIGDAVAWEQLSQSHVRQVLGLPQARQIELLQRAVAGGWTVVRLRREAAKVRAGCKKSRGGRPPTPSFARAIARARKALADDASALGDLDAVAGMDEQRRTELEDQLAFIQQRCAELATHLAQHQVDDHERERREDLQRGFRARAGVVEHGRHAFDLGA